MFAIGLFAGETNSVTGDSYLGFTSKYIARGMDFGELCLQPGMDIYAKNFAIGFWGSIDLSLGKMNEVDAYVSYSRSFKTVNFSVGSWLYTVPNSVWYAVEPFVTVGLNIPLSPYVSNFYDVINKCGYSEVGLKYNYFFDYSVNTGYYWDKAFSVVALKLEKTFDVGGMSIKTGICYQTPLSKGFKQAFSYGLTVTKNF